jgi:S-adenosylmethionine/arginine decarboxylase-like enzyme
LRRKKVHPIEKESFYGVMNKAISTEEDKDYWGFQLCSDLKYCDLNKMDSEENMKSFLKEIVSELKMVAIGEPIIKKFGEGKIRDLSALQLISTSHVSAHCDKTDGKNRVFMDVFSCKKYNPHLVFPLIRKYFDPKEISSIFILRKGSSIKVNNIHEGSTPISTSWPGSRLTATGGES